MPIYDYRRIFRALEAHAQSPVTYFHPGNLVAGDLFGDTTNNTGLAMPDCTIGTVHLTAGTAPASTTDVVVHNVTQGTSASYSLGSAADSFDASLAFDEGDQLALAGANPDATTPGADVNILCEVDENSRLVP